MTNPRDKIQQAIHYFIKPATHVFMAAVWSQVAEIFQWKEKHGWDSALVMRLRAAVDEFFDTEIDQGIFIEKPVRRWARQLAYMVLLQMDVEAPLMEKRWKSLVRILKKHKLV